MPTGRVCGLCNTCMAHCANHVPIADILRFERYAVDYRDRPGARRLYAQLEVNARNLRRLRPLLPHCPQGLEIPRKLAETHHLLSV